MRKFAFALLAIFFATSSFAQDGIDAPGAMETTTETTNAQDIKRTNETEDIEDANSKESREAERQAEKEAREAEAQARVEAREAAKEARDTIAVIPTQKFSWGVKVNANFATERGAPESGFRTSFAAGFFAEVKINNRLSFQPELLYSAQGSQQDLYAFNPVKGDLTLRFDYVNMPLLLKIYVSENNLSIEIGPQIGYLVNHQEVRLPQDGARIVRTIDGDWLNKLDVAAVLGVSYKAYGPFELYARYTYGFMKTFNDELMKSDNKQMKYFVDVKNSVLQLGVAARF